MGGFGGAVCEALADLGLNAPVLRLAIPDCFVTHGATPRLLSDVGLTAESIAAAVMGKLDDVRTESGDAAEAKAREAAPHRRGTR